jgi:hypothetical protein
LGWIGVPFRARGEEEALAIANDTEHGLSSCVFTRDAERGVRFAQRVQAGMTHVNGLPFNPFGGEENSGIGRSNGKWGVEAFTTATGSPSSMCRGLIPPTRPRSRARGQGDGRAPARTSREGIGEFAGAARFPPRTRRARRGTLRKARLGQGRSSIPREHLEDPRDEGVKLRHETAQEFLG